jgi:heme-degrading monooxygenase HmoA
MIARIWRGWTKSEDAAAYAEYVRETGLEAYRATEGNRGAWILQRQEGARTEILTVSFWESLDAVRAFAGEDVERAVFYPEDARYLVERDTSVTHYEIADDASARPR